MVLENMTSDLTLGSIMVTPSAFKIFGKLVGGELRMQNVAIIR